DFSKIWITLLGDLSDCSLNAFPIGLYVVLKPVAQNIHSINLANNEIKALTSKFFNTFTYVKGLEYQCNYRINNIEQSTHFHILPVHPSSALKNTKLKLLHWELNLAGNTLQRLPDEVNTLIQLKSINLSKNKIQDFPGNLLDIKTLEIINLEDNQITDVPVDKLSCMPSLQSVNLKANPINKDSLELLGIKFELLI
uniref:Leucine-rich repeat-containing 20 n=1 Tax=Xenopus tropicalis TaxID=8364 RepID=A0A803K4H2_XENTR